MISGLSECHYVFFFLMVSHRIRTIKIIEIDKSLSSLSLTLNMMSGTGSNNCAQRLLYICANKYTQF